MGAQRKTDKARMPQPSSKPVQKLECYSFQQQISFSTISSSTGQLFFVPHELSRRFNTTAPVIISVPIYVKIKTVP
jgi:hypothetical protein